MQVENCKTEACRGNKKHVIILNEIRDLETSINKLWDLQVEINEGPVPKGPVETCRETPDQIPLRRFLEEGPDIIISLKERLNEINNRLRQALY